MLAAFRDLIQDIPYDQLTVADIVSRAKVGRSTFYEHFAGKDGMLAASISGPFRALAATVGPDDNVQELVELLEHFWAQRRLARGLLMGPIREKTVRVLTRQIERRLRTDIDARRTAFILPVRLVAIQAAELLLAPIVAWLIGEARCPAGVLAAALRRASVAYLSAVSVLRGPSAPPPRKGTHSW